MKTSGSNKQTATNSSKHGNKQALFGASSMMMDWAAPARFSS